MPSPQELTALQRALSKNDLHIGAAKGGSNLPMPESEDAPIHKTAQLVQDWVGGPSPAEGPSQAVARIPPAEAKALGLALLDKIKGSLPEDIHDVLQFAQQKYPRVFGHLTNVKDGYMNGAVGVSRESLTGPAGYRRTPGLSNILIDTKRVEDPANTVGHELAHGAQRLWNPGDFGKKSFSQLYDEATKAVGYQDNPYEIGARKAGENFANKYKAR